VLGIPRQGSMREGAWQLTGTQKAMMAAAKVIPKPLMQRLADRAARKAAVAEQGSESNG
jgi:hypothetical protein